MTLKATFDPAVNLDLYFREARNGSKEFRFFNNGEPYELEDDFELRVDFGSELTKLNNSLTWEVTEEDTADVRRSYFWEIVNTTNGKTWLCGTAYFTETLSAEVTDSTDIEINLEGEIINITIIEGGGVFSGDVNGGTP
jgi:hypothetical protein